MKIKLLPPQTRVESNEASGMQPGTKSLSERDIQKLSEYVFNECRSLTSYYKFKQMLNKNSKLINIIKNEYNYSPFQVASKSGNYIVAEALLENGADVNTKDNFGNTALHDEIEWRRDIEFINLLLKKGANVNAVNDNGNTPLHMSITYLNISTNIAELLLVNGANVNAVNNYGETPLHMAARFGKIINVELLLEKDAKNVNAINKKGETPLHMAAISGKNSIVKLLLEKGANINAKDNMGRTAFDFANIKGYSDTASLLKDQHTYTDETNKVYNISTLYTLIETGCGFARIKQELEVLGNTIDLSIENTDGNNFVALLRSYNYTEDDINKLLETWARTQLKHKGYNSSDIEKIIVSYFSIANDENRSEFITGIEELPDTETLININSITYYKLVLKYHPDRNVFGNREGVDIIIKPCRKTPSFREGI